MNSSQDIEDQIEKTKRAAAVVNAFVVPSPLVGVENGKVVKAFLDEPEFLYGIERIKPIGLTLTFKNWKSAMISRSTHFVAGMTTAMMTLRASVARLTKRLSIGL